MILIVCNKEGLPFYQAITKTIDSPATIVTGESDLTTFLQGKHLNSVDLCIIQCELSWDNKYRSIQYGFRIAARLRHAGLRSVIYFHSHLLQTIKSSLLSEYAFMYVVDFHRFLPTIFRKEHLTLLEPKIMSEDLLEDICDTLLASKTLVRELIHDLKNKAILPEKVNNEETGQQLKTVIEDFFRQLSIIVKTQESSLVFLKNRLLNSILEAIEKKGSGQTISVIESFTKEIVALAPESEWSIQESEELPYTPWKVIFADDEENVRQRFATAFKKNHIRYELAASPDEVLSKLKGDEKSNFITALVSDIRFKDPKTNIWHPLQGYDLLRKVHLECPNLVSKFAVTAARKRLRRLKNNYHFPIQAYYKDDIQNSIGAMNIFCQKVRDEGDHVYFKSRSRPKLSSWIKGNTKRFAEPLANYYRAHLFSTDYADAEENINDMAYRFVNNPEEATTKKKNFEFTGTIRYDLPSQPDGLEKFRNRTLLGRRIALAFYLQDKSEDEIFELMQPDAEVKDLSASKKLLFNTSFALSFKKDLPDKGDVAKKYYLRSNLLEEEIIWLTKAFNADFNLEQIRLSQQELDTLILILGDLQFSLKKKQTTDKSILPLLNHFLQEDLEQLSTIKKAVELLNTGSKLSIHFHLQEEFYEALLFEKNYIHNTTILQTIKTFPKI